MVSLPFPPLHKGRQQNNTQQQMENKDDVNKPFDPEVPPSNNATDSEITTFKLGSSRSGHHLASLESECLSQEERERGMAGDEKENKGNKLEKRSRVHSNGQTKESRKRELEAEIKRLQTMLFDVDKSELSSVVLGDDSRQKQQQWDDGVVHQNSRKYPPCEIDQERDNRVDSDDCGKPSSIEQNHRTIYETETSISGVEESDLLEHCQENSTETLRNYETGPFAPREGKTLCWRHVNMTLLAKGSSKWLIKKEKQKQHRKILDDVWGQVPKQEVTALMGPSGAGKSSLLEILAGRISSRGSIRIENDIRFDNNPIDPRKRNIRKHIAFVAQDDSLQITSTPREAIRFSARLRLPRSTTEKELEYLTDEILTELGLQRCADTMIGGALLKGVSGGERKRTSVGVELVVKPSVVFLDEPTSGLDSFSAVQLCRVLKKVANAGASVLFTIHQPSSDIFNSFDHLILLNRGRVMYQGSVSLAPSYFCERGYAVPANFNPADWIMSVAQSVPIERLVRKGFFSEKSTSIDASTFTSKVSSGNISEDDEKAEESNCFVEKDSVSVDMAELENTGGRAIPDTAGAAIAAIGGQEQKVGISTQVYLQLQREGRNLYRDTKTIAARGGLTLFMSLLVGCVFYKVGSSDRSQPSNLQSVFGAITLILMQAIMGSALPALLTFPVERPVFLREYSTNHYSVASYFVSRLVIEAFITAVQIFLSTMIMYLMVDINADYATVVGISYLLGMTSTAMAVMLGCAVEDPKLGTELLPIVFVPQFILSGFFVTPSLVPVWLRWTRYIFPMSYSLDILMEAEFNRDCGSRLANTYCFLLLESAETRCQNLWINWVSLLILFIAFRSLALLILRFKATKFL